MKAVQYREFGGPEVLEIVELPAPRPAPRQIRVTVRAGAEPPGLPDDVHQRSTASDHCQRRGTA